VTSRQAFISKFVVLAEMCGKTLSEDLVAMYESALNSLGYHELSQALQEIILERGDRDPFPSIKTIRERIIPAADAESDAIEASNRIVQALSKFGGVNADLNCNEAKLFIGELGWLIVERQGGWPSMCERILASQIPTLKAQWRELGKALYERARRGTLNTPPALPKPEKNPRTLKLIDGVKTLNSATPLRSKTRGEDDHK
jgi:hypothetical protein